MLFRQKELNFAPGSEHLYSNGGYTLAAEIVTRVSGKPFPDFCAERIFKPLGMTHTHFHQDLHQLVKNRAYSYSGSAGNYTAAPLNYANVGATSLFTTASDLTKWLDNFRVGDKAAVARLMEQAVLTGGKQIDYALGCVDRKATWTTDGITFRWRCGLPELCLLVSGSRIGCGGGKQSREFQSRIDRRQSGGPLFEFEDDAGTVKAPPAPLNFVT